MRQPMPREFYIPKGAVKVADKQSDAVAYVYDVPTRHRWGALVFYGKQSKPTWHYTFKTPTAREARVREAFGSRRATLEAKAKSRSDAKRPHKLEAGHVLKASWGYEQTNVDFYQVVRVVSPSMVEIREIGQTTVQETGWATGKCIPMIDQFIGETMRKRVTDGSTVKLASYAYARLWDGHPVSWTAYH